MISNKTSNYIVKDDSCNNSFSKNKVAVKNNIKNILRNSKKNKSIPEKD